jgi:hypothetical protein
LAIAIFRKIENPTLNLTGVNLIKKIIAFLFSQIITTIQTARMLCLKLRSASVISASQKLFDNAFSISLYNHSMYCAELTNLKKLSKNLPKKGSDLTYIIEGDNSAGAICKQMVPEIVG